MQNTELKLPRLISDGMVLQRDIRLKIWGRAAPYAQVTIRFIDNTYTCVSDGDGRWAAWLPPLDAGGPYEMEISADVKITIRNILIGDVWVCAGQSNMQLTMDRVKEKYPEDIIDCDNEFIRLFTVPSCYDFKTVHEDLQSGEWISAGKDTILEFTAVGYFFAKELYGRYKVPIGLLATAIGGTPVESWLSEEAFRAFPEAMEEAVKCRDDKYMEDILLNNENEITKWHNALERADRGEQESSVPWYAEDYDASDWSTIKIPSYWADEGVGLENGVIWFRREIDVPEHMLRAPAKIYMGRIIDSDRVYINGRLIGSVSYQYPPRIYKIPDGVLKAGRNVITVRVLSERGKGGFVYDKPYRLLAGEHSIDLEGRWQYQIGAAAPPMPAQIFVQNNPTGLYNGMIAPLLSYKIKGVIWYQGESNTNNPSAYYELFTALIKDWRSKWGLGDFPFLYVQLPNYRELEEPDPDSNWVLLREAQLKALSEPNTAMAISIDIGEWNDLHPLDKKNVARRLFLAARSVAYGEAGLVYSGPLLKAARLSEGRAVLTFDHTGSGLMGKRGKELKGFEIAGPDGIMQPARAYIEGSEVIVWSDNIPEPAAVRYAWADDPADADLYNAEGLPASPFRTSLS